MYNSEYREDNKHWVLGAIIDNRQSQPIFLIEEKDRESKEESRKVFDDFFGAKVKITHVFSVQSLAHYDNDDNIELHAHTKQKV